MFFLIYLFLAISFELLTNSRCRNIEGNSISPKSADIPILDKRALQFWAYDEKSRKKYHVLK